MSEWHRVSPVANGIWSITEPGHVTMWLIVGSERALLFDTGMGFMPLRPLIERITPVPILVVASHHHFDHIGGNHEFDRVVAHSLGAAHWTSAVSSHDLAGYLAHTDRMLRAAAAVRAVDRDYLHLMDVDSDPAPLPSSVDLTTWSIRPRHPDATVADGDTFDLGDRVVRVLHTPGHTPDSICLHDSATGVLFAGDTVSSGPIYAHEQDSSLVDFAASTARLAAMKDEVSLVAMNHFGRVIAPPHLLQSVADAFDRLAASRVRARRTLDVEGSPVDEVPFDHFSIYVPPDVTPQ
ncbi:MBL fold metallo-hydrolase [Rhodococcus sp. NPDC058505]|uniref:MBL fold metallo-hydrolase n=1 Tax=unclassified Rhodococcus (in: high G+C Gram-positive bacteria) TaxID=192944 RepID=UPI003650EFC4